MIDNDTVQRVASVAVGSGLAAWMAKATGVDLLIMFAGGMAAAWFITPPVAEYLHLQQAERAIGFTLGFLVILVMRKLYEALHSLDAKEIGSVFVEKLRSFLGVQK